MHLICNRNLLNAYCWHHCTPCWLHVYSVAHISPQFTVVVYTCVIYYSLLTCYLRFLVHCDIVLLQSVSSFV